MITIFLEKERVPGSFSFPHYEPSKDGAWLDLAAIGAVAHGLPTMNQIADAVNELLSAYLGPLSEPETLLSRDLVKRLASFLNVIHDIGVERIDVEGTNVPELKTFVERQSAVGTAGSRRRNLRWEARSLPSRIGDDVVLLGAEPSPENALVSRDGAALSS